MEMTHSVKTQGTKTTISSLIFKSYAQKYDFKQKLYHVIKRSCLVKVAGLWMRARRCANLSKSHNARDVTEKKCYNFLTTNELLQNCAQ